MHAARCVLAVGLLSLPGCAIPMQISGLQPRPVALADLEIGKVYVFDMKTDQSGAGFRYQGEVKSINDRALTLIDATVEARLDRGTSMIERLLGEATTISREAERELTVERERVRSVAPVRKPAAT